MSIEERVDGALADLEGLLADGSEVEAAILEAASFYNLKPEVVQIRAEKKLGNLEAVRERYARLHIEGEREHRLKKSVQDYVDRFFRDHPKSDLPFVPINNWIKREFGDDLRSRDIAFATARVQMAFHRKVIRQLDAQD